MEELWTLAHEYGHFVSWKKKERTEEYMDALARFDSDKLIEGDNSLILDEEARAWRYGWDWLKREGAPDPAGFRVHVRKSFGIYCQLLKCDGRKIEEMMSFVFRQ